MKIGLFVCLFGLVFRMLEVLELKIRHVVTKQFLNCVEQTKGETV